mgnify:CR=1 FL=1|tara:strand:- start:215 stop:547 length:333 start_codon:yes stop_codon:yes gene_type:complete
MELNEAKEFSRILNLEIDKTKKSILKYTDLCQPISPDDAIGRVSRMDAINNKSVIESALREAKQKLFELNKIRDKLKESEFGECLKCKSKINIARLMIRPNSRLCINCAK